MESQNERFFEKKIKETAGEEDPLAAYISYHSWLKANKKTKKQQTVVVSRAIQKFRNDSRYKQDNRFVRLCTLYAQLLGNPIEYFDYLSRKQIGTEWALFYEAKALFQEKQSLFSDARDTYLEGIRRQAKPIDRLKNNYEEFKKRKAIKESESFEANSSSDVSAVVEPPVVEKKISKRREDIQVEELRARLYLKQQEQKKLEQTKLEEVKLRLEEEKRKKEHEDLERQRLEQEKKERKRKEREEKQRIRMERERKEQEEAERQEKERLALEAERKEKERQEAEKRERERKAHEERKRMELERKKREEAEKRERIAREEKEKRKREEAERKKQEQMAREAAERKEKERQEAEKREQEEQEKLRQQKLEQECEKLARESVIREKERSREILTQSGRAIDLSALDVEMSDPENDLTSDTEDLPEMSYEETEAGDKTIVLEDTLIELGDDLLTRSGSSMFNILDRTSNLNGTIHNTTVFQDKTVTIFTKKAQDIIQPSFCGPLSDEESEESESESESEESEDTHLHGFTGHFTTPMVDDPLAPFDICQDNSDAFDLDSFIKPSGNSSSGLTVFSDENQLPITPFDENDVLRELPIPRNDEAPFEVLTVEVEASSSGEEEDSSEENDFVIYSDPKQENVLTKQSPMEEFQCNETDGDKENEFHVYSSPPRANALPLQQSKSNPPSSPFVIFQDENSPDDIFALGESEDSSTFAVYKSPQSVPRSPFTVFQDNPASLKHNERDSDPFQMDLSGDTRSEDIFELSDVDDMCDSDDNTSDIFQEDEIVLFSDTELATTLYPCGTLNPYTHKHASELQQLPLFQSFMQQQKSQEIYAKWEECAPRSRHLQQAPKRMRSTKFKEDDFEEFPLFVGDRRSVTNSSVLSLGPCVGSGGFAKVFLAHHFLELDEDNDTMFVEETKRALKYQKHSEDPWAIRWEFYLMSMVHSRLSHALQDSNMYNAQYMSQRFCSAMYLREFDDASFLMLSYLDQGTLFDLINAHRVKNEKISEQLVAFLTLEILSILYALHSCHIIHGDIKPDNFLFMNENGPGTWEEWTISGEPSWVFRGLQLIDFGRGLDLSLYEAKEAQQFIGDNHVKELQCIEMREGAPWSYQVDLFGACAIIHLLLHLTPLEVTRKRPSRRCASVSNMGEYYLPKTSFNRRWSFDWELLFIDLLYVENSKRCLGLLEKHIRSLQEYVGANSKKIRVAMSREHKIMQEQGF